MKLEAGRYRDARLAGSDDVDYLVPLRAVEVDQRSMQRGRLLRLSLRPVFPSTHVFLTTVRPLASTTDIRRAPPPSVARQRSPTKRRPSPTGSSPRSRRPGPALTAPASAYVSTDARLEGTIILGEKCVLHPRSTVIVDRGASLTFGQGCVVEENAVVRFSGPGHAHVGEYNAFMIASRVYIAPDVDGGSIGSWNTFSPRCRVENVRVGDQCTFGADTVVCPTHAFLSPPPPSAAPLVPDRTVVYGAAAAARTWDGSGEAQEKNVRISATDYLCTLLPQ